MRLSELYTQGIRRVRLPPWNDAAFVLISEADPGHFAPWGLLYDTYPDPLTPTRVCVLVAFAGAGDLWEPYTDEQLADRRERFGQEKETP